MKYYGLVLIVFCSLAVRAQVNDIHLSWNGAKTVNTSSSVAITWFDNNKGDEVRYGADSNRLNKKQDADVQFVAEMNEYVCKATLEKLEPASEYFYKVGSEKNGWSKAFRFRTAPRIGDTSKILVGIWSDTQNNGGNYHFEQTDTIVQRLKEHPFNFTIHNGDIVENGSVIQSWKDFFKVGEPVNGSHPLMSVTGNHDVVNDTLSPSFQKPFPVFYKIVNLPHDQLNYSYDYGNAHFIAINSGYAQGAEKKGKVLFEPGSKEYKWLESDLKQARGNKKITWIILYCHYPLFSYGVSHIPTWQNHVQPLLDKYQVDLCLAGHRHVYERHKPIRGTQIFEPTSFHSYNHPQGTVYVTNGSCGGSLQGVGGQDLSTMIYTPTEKIYTYALMTIQGRTIRYEVFEKSGKQIDYFTLTK